MLLHFINHMLTAKEDIKFKNVSFLQFTRMYNGDINLQQNIIKPLCVDEANKEHTVIVVFSRKNTLN